jgi:queuine tRNA-ribosyltransferase
MGVGYPDQIAEYARMGVDMMDCVLPTRAARHGLLFRSPEPGEQTSDSGCPIHAGSIGVGGIEADTSAEAETASPTAIRMNIKRVEYAEDQQPIDPACGCPVCRRYTRAYLRHLFMAREPLGATLNSIHNLAFYLDIMERVREELAELQP